MLAKVFATRVSPVLSSTRPGVPAVALLHSLVVPATNTRATRSASPASHRNVSLLRKAKPQRMNEVSPPPMRHKMMIAAAPVNSEFFGTRTNGAAKVSPKNTMVAIEQTEGAAGGLSSFRSERSSREISSRNWGDRGSIRCRDVQWSATRGRRAWRGTSKGQLARSAVVCGFGSSFISSSIEVSKSLPSGSLLFSVPRLVVHRLSDHCFG